MWANWQSSKRKNKNIIWFFTMLVWIQCSITYMYTDQNVLLLFTKLCRVVTFQFIIFSQTRALQLSHMIQSSLDLFLTGWLCGKLHSIVPLIAGLFRICTFTTKHLWKIRLLRRHEGHWFLSQVNVSSFHYLRPLFISLFFSPSKHVDGPTKLALTPSILDGSC